MEVAFDLSTIWNQYLVKLDAATLRRLNPRKCRPVPTFIDHMGSLSAEAQHLRRVLTSYDKLVDSDGQQTLYVLWENSGKPNHSVVVGILKVGRRQLYLYQFPGSNTAKCYQTSPLCILDFYVHFTRQRKGFGHTLYDFMLQCEGVAPGAVAIDKPSESLICFMKKHYKLTNPVWQTTKYVVYPEFFQIIDNPPVPPKEVPVGVQKPQSDKFQLVDGYQSPIGEDVPEIPPIAALDQKLQQTTLSPRKVRENSRVLQPTATVSSPITPAEVQQEEGGPPPPAAGVPTSPRARPPGSPRGIASQANATSSSSETAKQRKIASMSHHSWF